MRAESEDGRRRRRRCARHDALLLQETHDGEFTKLFLIYSDVPKPLTFPEHSLFSQKVFAPRNLLALRNSFRLPLYQN